MPDEPKTETEVNYSRGRFNRAAIKRHLLRISKETRAGKFTRVSEDGIDEVEARAETKIREMLAALVKGPAGTPSPVATDDFLSGQGRERLLEAFNHWMSQQMQRVVNDIRTGQTI